MGVVRHPIPELVPPLFRVRPNANEVTAPPFLPLKPSDVLPTKRHRIVVSDAAIIDEVYAIPATSFPPSFMFGPITSVPTFPFPVDQSVPFTAVETGLTNVAFIRTQIELINHIFSENEVDEIWITFPDPQIKYKRTKHRMTNSQFLKLYKKVLKPEGVVNLKTDSEFMHGYTLGLLHGEGHEVIYSNHNVYVNEGSPEEVTGLQTFYEKQYLEINKAITYIRFKIK